MKPITGIYRIIKLSTGESYIGQSIDIYTRWEQHKKTTGGWHDDLMKFPEDYVFQILEECNPSELDVKEIEYIKKYDSFYNGLNQTLGGKNGLRPIQLKNNPIKIKDTFNLIYEKKDFTEEEIQKIKVDLLKKSVKEKFLEEAQLALDETVFFSCAGELREEYCHHDGYCSTCSYYIEEMKKVNAYKSCFFDYPNIPIKISPLRIHKGAKLTGYIFETIDEQIHAGISFIIIWDTDSMKYFSRPFLFKGEFGYANILIPCGTGYKRLPNKNKIFPIQNNIF